MTTDDTTTVPPHDWDDTVSTQFRWRMPDSRRSFRVEVDEDGGVEFLTGEVWTVQHIRGITADEARWLSDIWPSVLRTIDSYTGVESVDPRSE
ncbi:hypothetical protein [Gordonia sp. WA4-43]|uniref:hypothetical protein n=1 Tax=Gordonia sp. WA4-43 TaxID=2878678 RepID=UPI001CF94A0D|nr:hypothetical protein [Gordonia sp. WA4-43]UCZ88618.1 hypothetical protein LEL84_16230 [Gordonia sp. WA4-43]